MSAPYYTNFLPDGSGYGDGSIQYGNDNANDFTDFNTGSDFDIDGGPTVSGGVTDPDWQLMTELQTAEQQPHEQGQAEAPMSTGYIELSTKYPPLPADVQFDFSAPAQAPQYPALPAQGPPGSLFHPAVGWYWPVPPVMLVGGSFSYSQAPKVPMQPFFHKRHADGRTDSTSQKCKRPSEAQDESEEVLPKRTTTRKHAPCFSIADNLDMSDDEEKEYEQRPRKKRAAARAVGGNKKSIAPAIKLPSIAQACICGNLARRIRRPRNAFILFRQHRIKEIIGFASSKDQGHISAKAGEMWKVADAATKKFYFDLAKKEAEEHAVKFPDYKFTPKKRALGGQNDERFGTKECTCGAYLANVRKARAAGVELDAQVPNGDDDDPTPAPTTRRRQSFRAPAAQMTAPSREAHKAAVPQHTVVSGLALPGARRPSTRRQSATESQAEASLAAYLNAYNRRVSQSASSPALPGRRQSVRFQPEPADEPSGNNARDVDPPSAQTAQAHHELADTEAAPLNTVSFAARAKRRPSQILAPANAPPAMNTRSRASLAPETPIDLPTAEGLPEDLSYLFEDDPTQPDAVDEFCNLDWSNEDGEQQVENTARRSSVRTSTSSSRKGSDDRRKSPRLAESWGRRQTSSGQGRLPRPQ